MKSLPAVLAVRTLCDKCRGAIDAPSTNGATPVDVGLTLPPMKDNTSEFQGNGVPSW